MMSGAAATILLVIMHSASGVEVNDIQELNDAKQSQLITLKTLHVPPGITLRLTKLKPGTVVEIDGTITFGYAEWKGPLVQVVGTNISIEGKSGNLFDCQGERWWDGKGGNGGKVKPKFFTAMLKDSTIKGLNVKNTPVHAFSIRGCSNVNISRINIDNSDGDFNGGHNTDGFDVNSEKVVISDSYVHNQDDCLAVNSGSDVTFENNDCVGGHGISIGSVGGRDNNDVRNVMIRHCRVTDSDNGIRVKTVSGATGSVRDVTFDDVVLRNIAKNGIVIQGNYKNVGSGGEPTPGVPIQGLTVNNVRGNVLPRGANIYVWVANASDWKWNANVTGGQKRIECTGIPSGVDIDCGK